MCILIWMFGTDTVILYVLENPENASTTRPHPFVEDHGFHLPSLQPLSIVKSMPPHLWLPNTAKQSLKHFSHSNTREEALSLYREILRTAKAFHWCDEKGQPWNIRLRKEARQEFEASKEERDPLIIARMIVTGRDCVQQIQNKFNEADRAAWSRIERERER